MEKKFFQFALLFLSLFAGATTLSSQTYSITGTITDSTDNQPVFGASLLLTEFPDTNKIIAGGVTDSLGRFSLDGISNGNYRIRISTAGYKRYSQVLTVNNTNLSLGNRTLSRDGILLKGVAITDNQVRMTQNGDTTNYNAGAFKTNPDATAGDLVAKMPGMSSEGGTVKHNGEEVKQVLVDGKPYFGEDPNAALKNIPADMIDGVQVYEKSSEQAQFTGFDDGNSKKTINIVTKKQAMNGRFGKIYAGYGTNDRYNSGVTMNIFKENQRVTILGLSNNINQQNFSMQDLFGSMGGGGTRVMMPRGGRGGGMSNLSVGQQNGLTATHAFGLNYSDEWGPKIKASGSYFFNYSENIKTDSLTRTYFSSVDSLLYYLENSSSGSRNINHRFNFRLEYTLDSMNAIIISPRLTSQFTAFDKLMTGTNYNIENAMQSRSVSNNHSLNLGYNFGNNITYRHRFLKRGRTFTIDISTSYNKRNGSGKFNSENIFGSDTLIVDQHSTLYSDGITILPSMTWSEPAGKKGQLLFTYAPSWTRNVQDKITNNIDQSNEYTVADSVLSNKFENFYLTQRGGVSYRYNGEKASLTFGADMQSATLTGNQSFPESSSIARNFSSILPSAQFSYKIAKGKNLRINYRTSNNPPSITQLQEVVDNSNPLQLQTGNPNLEQNFQQTLMAHYGFTNAEKATGFFIFFYGNVTRNYVGNSTFIASRDTLLPNGISLNPGSQLTMPVNLNGYRSARTFVTYSFPLAKLKSNLGLSASGGFSRTPALINAKTNLAQTITAGPAITLSSNVSEKVDFTISYSGTYNLVTNSIQTQANNNYFNHIASLKFNWMFYKGFVWNTSLDQNIYNGLGQGYNTNFLLWNASLGYKFFKNKSLEVKLSVFDILKQNTSVSRTITDTYVEDTRNNVLSQYFMLTVTWNIKKFIKPEATGDGTTPQPQPSQPQHPTGK